MNDRDSTWAPFGQSLALCDDLIAFNAFLRRGAAEDAAGAGRRACNVGCPSLVDHTVALGAQLEAHRSDLLAFQEVHDRLQDRVAWLEAALAEGGPRGLAESGGGPSGPLRSEGPSRHGRVSFVLGIVRQPSRASFRALGFVFGRGERLAA